MAILQVRDIDDRLYDFLKRSAKLRNRSISQEVITIMDDMDLLIAATAMYMNLSIVTKNRDHFSRIDELKLESLGKI